MAVSADRYKGVGRPVREDIEHPARRAVYVWELPIRTVHWVIVLSIIVLSITGYYLHHPFLEGSGTIGEPEDGFALGTMRFIHEVAAFILIAALILRVYWAFMGNRYAHWRALVPLKQWQRDDLKTMLRYYALRRRHPARFNGHNPLAGLAYLVFYAFLLVEVITGLALFAWVIDKAPWDTFFAWPYHLFGIQDVRLWHFLIMFVFIAFAIHHVYSAILIDIEERNGELSSMFSGWKADVEHPEEPGRTPRDAPERALL